MMRVTVQHSPSEPSLQSPPRDAKNVLKQTPATTPVATAQVDSTVALGQLKQPDMPRTNNVESVGPPTGEHEEKISASEKGRCPPTPLAPTNKQTTSNKHQATNKKHTSTQAHTNKPHSVARVMVDQQVCVNFNTLPLAMTDARLVSKTRKDKQAIVAEILSG